MTVMMIPQANIPPEQLGTIILKKMIGYTITHTSSIIPNRHRKQLQQLYKVFSSIHPTHTSIPIRAVRAMMASWVYPRAKSQGLRVSMPAGPSMHSEGQTVQAKQRSKKAKMAISENRGTICLIIIGFQSVLSGLPGLSGLSGLSWYISSRSLRLPPLGLSSIGLVKGLFYWLFCWLDRLLGFGWLGQLLVWLLNQLGGGQVGRYCGLEGRLFRQGLFSLRLSMVLGWIGSKDRLLLGQDIVQKKLIVFGSDRAIKFRITFF